MARLGDDSDDLHRSFQVIGENVQTHLGTDAWQRLREEVRRSHPRFQCSECMLDSLPTRACIASNTCSCSQRAMRRYSPLVHCDLIGHLGHADDQYL